MNPFDTLNAPNQGLAPSPPVGQPVGQPMMQQNPQLKAVLQQLMMQQELNKPGYSKGIPTEVYNLLDPNEQMAIDSANPQLMIELKKDLMGDESFMNASKKGDMPAVTQRIRKYLELYRLTGLETNKVTGEKI